MHMRRLRLQGLYNTRDLGGFPTKDGGSTRFGVFLRSEAPCEIGQTTIDALCACGVTASVDLRSTYETQVRPSDLKGSAAYYHCPLFHEAAVPAGQQPAPPPPMDDENFDWGKSYCDMAEQGREWAVSVLKLAAEEEGVLLYHCTTGKDRTGLLTCYLLSIAEVAREDIAADYCVSEVYLQPVYVKLRTDGAVPPDPGHPFFHTPPEAMLFLIDYLTKTYGGVVEYLRTIGVSDETISRIRAKLVER